MVDVDVDKNEAVEILSLNDDLDDDALRVLSSMTEVQANVLLRCRSIISNIDLKAVEDLGSEHLRHVVFVDRLTDAILRGENTGDQITASMHAHLEELFTLTQKNYSLTDEQKQIIRDMCRKYGVEIPKEA
jgi:hypothetical protein